MEGSRELRNQWTVAGSKTKPWNVTLTNVEPNEQLYIDYKVAAKINQTSVKFKTTPDRIKFWVTSPRVVTVMTSASLLALSVVAGCGGLVGIVAAFDFKCMF